MSQNIFKNFNIENHHFYILVGNSENIKTELQKFCFEKLKLSKSTIFNYDFDRLLIDDAKKIVAQSIIKTESGQKMVLISFFNNITPEAQNAFLKSIEEPSKDTVFFFIVPRTDIFLPTVLSRAITINCSSVDGNNINNNQIIDKEFLKKLLAKNIAERIKWADDFAKKIADEKIPKSDARKLVQEIIKILSESLIDSKEPSKNLIDPTKLSKNPQLLKSLKSLQKIDDYLNDSGASIKILLEKMAIDLPNNLL